ncbi:isochorismatase family protein [Streptacidiphilus sp. MAP5-52]|uniref:isochorismatase family protein n=1 Tax=Streptacidiphilus sp. MAP5-52 TaxID=3156267 RepID=UPI0035121260
MSDDYEGIGVYIDNDRGEVLLHLRDDKDGIAWPGYWSIIGGTRDHQDTGPAHTAVRELFEELGLHIRVEDLVPFRAPAEDYGRGEHKLFRLRWNGVVEDLVLGEGRELRMVPIDAIADMHVPPHVKANVLHLATEPLPEQADARPDAQGWPAEFARLLAGEGCGMCETPDEDDIGRGIRFFRGTYLDAYLWRSGKVRGYTVARWKGPRHVADPTDLDEQEAAGFWRELLTVQQVLKQHYEPLKLNIALFGNVLPHLHAHIFPRTVDDLAPGAPMPWTFLEWGTQDEEQLAADAAALRLLAHPDADSRPGGLVHRWRIEPREYQRQEDRRGRRHGYLDLDPQRTALVVVDVVPFFDGPFLRGIVPQINEIAGAMRTVGGSVFWVLPGRADVPSSVREEFLGTEVAEMYRASGGTGPLPPRLLDGLAVDEDRDVLLEKTGTSALFPGSSDLHQFLQERGITTLVLCGTVTSVCVEGTARDAAALGYRVIVVADGCAGGTDEAHNASLRVIYRSFGDVRPAGEVLDLIHAGSIES